MNLITVIIGQRIRTHRLQRGLTQEALAEMADLHPTYIGQAERGEKNLTLVSLEKILNALDITFADFFEHMNASRPKMNVANQCYELISSKSQGKQERIYRILLEIDQLME